MKTKLIPTSFWQKLSYTSFFIYFFFTLPHFWIHILFSKSPYLHFNTVQRPSFHRLFDFLSCSLREDSTFPFLPYFKTFCWIFNFYFFRWIQLASFWRVCLWGRVEDEYSLSVGINFNVFVAMSCSCWRIWNFLRSVAWLLSKKNNNKKKMMFSKLSLALFSPFCWCDYLKKCLIRHKIIIQGCS